MDSRAEISGRCLALYRQAAAGRNISELELVALALALATRLDEQVDMRRVEEIFRRLGGIPAPAAVAEAARLKRNLPEHEPEEKGQRSPGLGRVLFQEWKKRKDVAQ